MPSPSTAQMAIEMLTLPPISTENAERMENCFWKMMIVLSKIWPILLQLEVQGLRALPQRGILRQFCCINEDSSIESEDSCLENWWFWGDQAGIYIPTLARHIVRGKVAICFKVDEFCIKLDEKCTKNDEFCIKNDEFCINNYECRRSTRSSSQVKLMNVLFKMMNFVLKLMNSSLKMMNFVFNSQVSPWVMLSSAGTCLMLSLYLHAGDW